MTRGRDVPAIWNLRTPRSSGWSWSALAGWFGGMTLPELTARAESIRRLFAQRETASNGRPWTGTELALGFAGDVGELAKLVMAKEGRRSTRHQDLDAALAHELADCLWSVLVLAKTYNVDLEQAFNHTMDQLETSLSPTNS